jgi:hypothetical protein
LLTPQLDAFYGPSYWQEFNPLTPLASSEPGPNLTLDTHQYYAFAPLNNLPHDTILQSICNISGLLKQKDGEVPYTVVGEWSLETGMYLVVPRAWHARDWLLHGPCLEKYLDDWPRGKQKREKGLHSGKSPMTDLSG